jgi:hypothetical protein
MAGRSRYDNPFEEGGGDEVNPFAVSSPASSPCFFVSPSENIQTHLPFLLDSSSCFTCIYRYALLVAKLIR